MIDLFENKLDLSNMVCHSGGADGADTIFSIIGKNMVLKPKHIHTRRNIIIVMIK